MTESLFPLNFFAAALAALVLGYIAHRLHLPPLVGYLLAGVALSPHTPGFKSDPELIRNLAGVGVAFLMFAVGTEVRLTALQRVGKVGLLGGIVQVALTMAVGALVGRAMGAGWPAALFFGALVSISSTVVAVKLLFERGHHVTIAGQISIAVLLVQDLIVIPFILILPVLGAGQETSSLATGLLVAFGKATGIIVVGGAAGLWVVPRLFERIVRVGSQELTVLAAVSLALGSAIATEAIGVSAAIGAFLAGLAIARVRATYDFARVFSPLEGVFGIFFFISVGTLFDPGILTGQIPATVITVALVVVGKFLVVALVTRLFGYGRRVSVTVGIYLAQMGELSFVLAGLGLTQRVITSEQYNLVLAAAIVSMFTSPFFVRASTPAIAWASRQRWLRRALLDFRPEVPQPS